MCTNAFEVTPQNIDGVLFKDGMNCDEHALGDKTWSFSVGTMFIFSWSCSLLRGVFVKVINRLCVLFNSLATNSRTTFGKQVDFFVKCTIEGSETNPLIVVRNVSCHNGSFHHNVIIIAFSS